MATIEKMQATIRRAFGDARVPVDRPSAAADEAAWLRTLTLEYHEALLHLTCIALQGQPADVELHPEGMPPP